MPERIRIALAIAWVALLLRAGPSDAAFFDDWFLGCDTDAYRVATLTLLISKGLHPDPGHLLGCGWIKYCDTNDIAEAHVLANRIREFAKSYPDKCAAAQIKEWAWYTDYMADKGEREMKTNETRDMLDSVKREQNTLDERARNLGLK